MTIKEAILDNEKDLIKDFLLSCDLNYENTIEESLYAIDDKSNIIGTISREGNIIKCFAIDKNYRQDGLSSSLISEMIKIFLNFEYNVQKADKYISTELNIKCSKELV